MPGRTDVAALQRFLAILLADLRERTRSPRFWVLLLLIVAGTWRCFPPTDAGYMVLSLNGDLRGEYSSAWVGMVLAMVYSSLLSLAGFYVVRGTLVRDIETRVWQLLVATPMTRGGYLLAKWASHMAVFALIVVAGLGVGLIAQWVRAEDRSIDLWELAKPALLLNLPGLAVTAMLAIWFDLLPWLRRTAGNVLFFFLWITTTTLSVIPLENPTQSTRNGWLSDPNGLVVVARDFHRVRELQTGTPQQFGFNIGVQMQTEEPQRFEWKTWPVRALDTLGRSFWLLGALGGVLLAARLLDWAAARGSTAATVRSRAGRRMRWLDWGLDLFARGRLGLLAVAELKMALRQRPFWWWLAALLAFGLQLFAPGKGMQVGMLLAWILPLDILARGILREADHGTGGLVFAAPNILRRLVGARLAVGFALLIAMTLPGLLRLLATSPISALAALIVCASIASWGLCLGALCRTPRPFELALLVATYAALQDAPVFDLTLMPQQTALWHGLLLLPAWMALAWAWPRLARR